MAILTPVTISLMLDNEKKNPVLKVFSSTEAKLNLQLISKPESESTKRDKIGNF